MQARDLQQWAEDPEGFHHEAVAGSWEEQPRACAERLFMLLVKVTHAGQACGRLQCMHA
jgi:hypothetical protein